MRKQLPVPLTRFETVTGGVYWALQLLIVPVAITLVAEALGLKIDDAQLNFIYFCLNFIVTTLLLGKFCLGSLAVGFARPWYTLQAAGLGMAGIMGSNLLFSMVILRLKPDFINLNNDAVAALVEQNFGLMAVGTVVLAPIVEELLYRAVIFGSLYKRSKTAAYMVSTAVFSLVHILAYIPMYDPVTLVLCFLQYLPYGMCMAWAYARSGSIVAPILMHMSINQIALLSLR